MHSQTIDLLGKTLHAGNLVAIEKTKSELDVDTCMRFAFQKWAMIKRAVEGTSLEC